MKNTAGFDALVREGKLTEASARTLKSLADLYRPFREGAAALRSFAISNASAQMADHLAKLCDILDAFGVLQYVYLDFSLVNSMDYYNGLIFQGAVEEIPFTVLSGGRYDRLPEKMGKKFGAIGFALDLDTGVGGASIASTKYLAEIMRERNIHMSFGVGGIAKPMCDLLEEGLIGCLVDTQDFDQDAIRSAATNPRHFYITADEYANPFNKGAYVNKLDFVILAALEVDTHFNCNVVVGSDGVITGAQGGHPDTAAGAKCTIVIAPIMQGRIPTICSDCTTVTTPGEDVDVVVTDYGIAINPKRQDLIDAVAGKGLPIKTIEELRDIAYSITGEPEKVQFGDRVVGIIEARDGSVMDVVRQIKPFEFKD